jgi:type II secretory pathway pseudopilin PulG
VNILKSKVQSPKSKVIGVRTPRPREHANAGQVRQGVRAPRPDFGLWTLDSGLRAFSLIEIMVVVGLLTVIILGLLAMFHQVQKAFRESMTQVDVLEAGRATTDRLVREIAESIASQLPYLTNGTYRSTNFFARVDANFTPALLQNIPGTTKSGVGPFRTNVVQSIFFMTKQNQTWTGTGYQVRPDYPGAGVGTLYRFSTNTLRATRADFSVTAPPATQPALGAKSLAMVLSSNFVVSSSAPLNFPPPDMNRIADGVVHFRVTPYDTNGVPFFVVPSVFPSRSILAFSVVTNATGIPATIPVNNSYASYDPAVPGQLNCYFLSNAMPAYVELEIGFLEPHILDRYKAIASGFGPGAAPPAAIVNAQRNYLSNHVAQVHLFRQRIPIRNVDFAAYQ